MKMSRVTLWYIINNNASSGDSQITTLMLGCEGNGRVMRRRKKEQEEKVKELIRQVKHSQRVRAADVRGDLALFPTRSPLPLTLSVRPRPQTLSQQRVCPRPTRKVAVRVRWRTGARAHFLSNHSLKV